MSAPPEEPDAGSTPPREPAAAEPSALLERAVAGDRVASAYLLWGPGGGPREAALRFARALVCRGDPRPCGACLECRRSLREAEEPVEIDGTGKRGPLFRHVGDHPDLLWVERGAQDTRVRIGQIRAVQAALRLGAHEGGWRVAVVADAEWLNQEAQNALLRILEEPPARTCLVLVSAGASALLPTIRSRCQRVRFAPPPSPGLRAEERAEEERETALRLDGVASLGLPDLLDWAEQYRGERGRAVEGVHRLLAVGSEWLGERVREALAAGDRDVRAELDAFRALARCRKDLDQRNANPQMVAERALLAVREAVA